MVEEPFRIKCKSCGMITDTFKDDFTPENAKGVLCNWCPSCEDSAHDYYEEYFIDYVIEIEDPNQTKLF